MKSWRSNISLKESVRNRHVIIGVLPFVKITSLNRDATSVTNVCSDTLRLVGSAVKTRRKVVVKHQLPY